MKTLPESNGTLTWPANPIIFGWGGVCSSFDWPSSLDNERVYYLGNGYNWAHMEECAFGLTGQQPSSTCEDQ